MGFELASAGLVEQLGSLATAFDSEILVGVLFFAVTAGAIGLCIPGLLMPISFAAGMLMGDWTAIPTVATGAALGSYALFLLAHQGVGSRMQSRFGGRFERYGPHLQDYGMVYVVGLRVIGTPHALVTLASAAARLRHSRFLAASLLGFLPAIALSAGAGAAL